MTYTQTLRVDLEQRGYDIVVGENLLANAGEYLKKILPLPHVFIVTDENVAKLHLKTLEKSLSTTGIAFESLVIEAGEKSKSFPELVTLLDRIFEHRPERNTTLVALGGGVVGDLTGFAASILLRGVNFIQIPTTLLAQVDSSVGGKTGINNAYGKNLIGSFYQPTLVLADIGLLKTLPRSQFLSGYAEVVKYGLLGDVDFFNWLESHKEQLLNQETEALTYAVTKSCQAKADIVAADEREKGSRALLNLGHTFAHVLEEATGYSDILPHGQAVAIGMVLAFKLSHALGHCNAETVRTIEAHLRSMGLPTSPLDIQTDWNTESLVDHMFQDKKVSNGKLVFILAKAIGKAFIEKGVDRQLVCDTLNTVINPT